MLSLPHTSSLRRRGWIFLFLFLLYLPFTTANAGNLNETSQEQIVTHAFVYLNKVWATKGAALSRKETEKYFDPNTTLMINGKTVYAGISQLDNHFRAVGNHIIGKIRFPFIKVINADDQLIVRFDEDIHDLDGRAYPAQVIAIFTLYHGRIKTWDEVAYTAYFCQPE